MKKLQVNSVKCIGCGACVGLDPEHFDFNDAGLSEAISQENLDSADLEQAKEGCPTAAIEIVEDGAAQEAQENVEETVEEAA